MTDAVKTSPRWQGLEPTGRTLDNGDTEPGKPVIITCHGHTETGICAECAADFTRVLADVPALFDDLDIAISGEAKFVEHGFRGGGFAEGEVGGSRNPAVAAQQRLTLAILGDGTAAHPGVSDFFDARDPGQAARHLCLYLARLAHEPRLPRLAHDISSSAARAHHVIDTPKDLVYYGPCPDCQRDIVQERIHKDDTDTKVQCHYLTCGYSQTLDLYYKRVLEASLDRHFTIAECVGMVSNAGQTVTRDQLNGWIRHKGLPREWTDRPEWRNGALITVGMWTLKLRDVVDFIQKREAKLAS